MRLDQLLEFLNLSDKDGLYSYDDLSSLRTGFLPNRLIDALKNIAPNYFFCINNEPLLLFFDRQEDLELLQKQIWNFNQSPAIFIHSDEGWIVKNGFNLLENRKELETIASQQDNSISDFEYFQIITGKSWEKYQDNFKQSNRVDYYLLKNIENVRTVLTDQKQGNLFPQVANFLIGRVIFIRYLIDRKVELNKYGITEKEDFYNLLDDKEKAYDFFQQVKDDFNGNLFPLSYEADNIEVNEKDQVGAFHLSRIKQLLQGATIHKDASYQSSLFDIYDFSIIPIEFISNVYEKFIGVAKQADSGAYYTPLFLVDYMQKETVSKYFKENPAEYNCKVLDPACGSGIFLVETLRQIISQYQINNPEYLQEKNYEAYKDTLKQLLKDNIFGVDKDENAISVAIFSLYITLLDNLAPKSIVGFRFPELVGANFFANDFFDTDKPFDTELKKHHFQFILGNPPWATKHPKEKQPFEKYIESRRKKDSTLEIENREIAEAFLVRVGDFDFDETALIVVSKVLYKISRKKEKRGVFRRYLLNNFKIRQVFELSSVRHLVFGADKKKKNEDKGTAPATILFYSKSAPEEEKNNVIKHISLKPNIFFKTFKLLVIEKYDVKKIAQKYFIENDWLWKVLVYGNVLDYFFIKRLKDSYNNIKTVISDSNKFTVGQGIMEYGGDENDFSEFVGAKFINTNKRDVKQYYVTHSDTWVNPIVHRKRKPELFDKNVLLITGGTNNKFQSVSGLSYEKAVFKSSLTGIKAIEKDGLGYLKAISAILNSSFFAYYIVQSGSSIGIEREETHDIEKWDTPFSISDDLILQYNTVEALVKQYHSNTLSDSELRSQIEREITKIDGEVARLFKTSKQEQSLIDYTNNISIALLKGYGNRGKKVISKIKYRSDFLEEYAQIFIDHFSKRFNGDGHFFEVDIIHSEHTILIKFKIIPQPSKHANGITWSKARNKELLTTLANLGFLNLSDNLYLQKDIKGLEEDYFYIAKPNQYKSWHPALAHLDLSEFIEAFFQVEQHSLNED